MEKTPNIIYLDLSLNASTPSLCGALVQLAQLEKPLMRQIAQLKLESVFVRLAPALPAGLNGHSLVLENEWGQQLGWEGLLVPRKAAKTGPRSPQWHEGESKVGDAETIASTDGAGAQRALQSVQKAPVSKSIWEQDTVALPALKAWLQSQRLKPMVQNMCYRILKYAFECAPLENKENGLEAQQLKRMFIYALSVGMAFETLNPVAVGCSEIPFNTKTRAQKNESFIWNWALNLSTGLPTFEDPKLSTADIFSLAILNTIVTDWGYRPRGKIDKIERGGELSSQAAALVYLIVPPAIASSKTQILSHERSVNWEILLAPQGSVALLRQGLKRYGATNFMVLPVHQGAGEPLSLVKVTLPLGNIREAQEWCFTEGLAQKISSYFVQEESLSVHEVQLPWGRGPAQEVVTVVENWWLDQVVRVVPDEEDVTRIALQTGFTTEAVRSDIVRTWQRWSDKNAEATEKR